MPPPSSSEPSRPHSESFGNDNRYLPGSSPNQLSFDPDGIKLNIDSSPTSSSPSSPSLTPVTTPLVPYTTQPDASPFTPLSQTQHDSFSSFSTYSDYGVAQVPRLQQQHQQPQPSRSAGLGNAAPFSDNAITNGTSTSHNLKLPFRCNICDKRYAQRQGLNRHRSEKHDPNLCMYSYCA